MKCQNVSYITCIIHIFIKNIYFFFTNIQACNTFMSYSIHISFPLERFNIYSETCFTVKSYKFWPRIKINVHLKGSRAPELWYFKMYLHRWLEVRRRLKRLWTTTRTCHETLNSSASNNREWRMAGRFRDIELTSNSLRISLFYISL